MTGGLGHVDVLQKILLFTVILGFVDWDRPGDSQLMDWDTETLDW